MFSVQENHILLQWKYHAIADGMTNILYAAEIVMGKDTPPDYAHEYEKENKSTISKTDTIGLAHWDVSHSW